MEQTATDKALDVLFFLRDEQAARGITEISKALSLPKSSAHRMVATLTRRGLLERDDQGRYRLGIALLSLGMGFLNQDPLVVASQPVLNAVASDLGETCFLVAARAGELVVLAKAEGTGMLRVSPQVGSRVPAGATAAGKLYLAHAPHEIRSEIAPEPLYTTATLAGESLEAAIAEAASCGYSLNVDEWIEGLSVLAVPVFAHTDLCGVIALAFPSSRLGDMLRASFRESSGESTRESPRESPRHLDRDMGRSHAFARVRRAATELRARLEGRLEAGSDSPLEARARTPARLEVGPEARTEAQPSNGSTSARSTESLS